MVPGSPGNVLISAVAYTHPIAPLSFAEERISNAKDLGCFVAVVQMSIYSGGDFSVPVQNKVGPLAMDRHELGQRIQLQQPDLTGSKPHEFCLSGQEC